VALVDVGGVAPSGPSASAFHPTAAEKKKKFYSAHRFNS